MAGSDNRDRRDTGTEETREAVLADAYALCKGFKDAGFDGDAHDIRVLFERLEAAHKRELESVTKRNGLGNVAKLREALEDMIDRATCYFQDLALPAFDDDFRGAIIDKAPDYVSLRDDWIEDIIGARKALAATPRNCDVGTADEQGLRFESWCAEQCDPGGYDMCAPCKLRDQSVICQLVWAQLPYDAAQEGGKP